MSVNRPDAPAGTRCEIKNLNSVKFMMVAISKPPSVSLLFDYSRAFWTACEVFRQIELLEKGLSVPQETRGFDEAKAETFSLRSKEDAPDYRYMPDPNLPPLLLDQVRFTPSATAHLFNILGQTYIRDIRKSMPELPPETRSRLLAQGLSERDADVLMAIDMGREVGYDGSLGHGAVAYFDTVARGRDSKIVVNWYDIFNPYDLHAD